MLLMGKSTISMAIFNSYVSHYQRVYIDIPKELAPRSALGPDRGAAAIAGEGAAISAGRRISIIITVNDGQYIK